MFDKKNLSALSFHVIDLPPGTTDQQAETFFRALQEELLKELNVDDENLQTLETLMDHEKRIRELERHMSDLARQNKNLSETVRQLQARVRQQEQETKALEKALEDEQSEREWLEDRICKLE